MFNSNGWLYKIILWCKQPLFQIKILEYSSLFGLLVFQRLAGSFQLTARNIARLNDRTGDLSRYMELKPILLGGCRKLARTLWVYLGPSLVRIRCFLQGGTFGLPNYFVFSSIDCKKNIWNQNDKPTLNSSLQIRLFGFNVSLDRLTQMVTPKKAPGD